MLGDLIGQMVLEGGQMAGVMIGVMVVVVVLKVDLGVRGGHMVTVALLVWVMVVVERVELEVVPKRHATRVVEEPDDDGHLRGRAKLLTEVQGRKGQVLEVLAADTCGAAMVTAVRDVNATHRISIGRRILFEA